MHEGFEIPVKSDVEYLNWLLKVGICIFQKYWDFNWKFQSTSTFEKFQSVLREIFLQFQNTNY